MLAEVMQHIKAEDERMSARRSLAIASRLGLGPFKKTFQQSGAFSAIEVSKPTDPLQCEMGEPTFTIESFQGLKNCSEQVEFKMKIGGLALCLFLDKNKGRAPIIYYNVGSSQRDEYWVEPITVMSQYMVRHVIEKIRDAMRATSLLQDAIDAEPDYKKSGAPIDALTLRDDCEENLKIFEANAPWQRSVQIHPRPKHKKRFGDNISYGNGGALEKEWRKPVAFVDDSQANLVMPYTKHISPSGRPIIGSTPPNLPLTPFPSVSLTELFNQLKNAPLDIPSSEFKNIIDYDTENYRINDKGEPNFEDMDVTVKAVPVFGKDPEATIKGKHAVFHYQQHGVIYWIQFTDLNGDEANDFMMVSPRAPRARAQEKRPLYKEEALAALDKIKNDVGINAYPWMDSVLKRLTASAEKLDQQPPYYTSPSVDAYMRALKKNIAEFQRGRIGDGDSFDNQFPY